MSEEAPFTPQGESSGDVRIVDPVKAEEMAYAGKLFRERAVGTANAIKETIANGGDVVTDPYYEDRTGNAHVKYSVLDALKAADTQNWHADIAETKVAEQYDALKAEKELALTHLEAIKAGKRIVLKKEQPK